MTPPPRNGYTLLELLLVLSIVVVLAGITWPSVEGMYQRRQLRAAAEDVRGDLAAARLQAVESGRALQFLYQPGGRSYEAVPAGPTSTAAGAMPAGETDSTEAQPAVSGRLPENVHFEPVPAATAASPSPAGSGSQQRLAAGATNSGTWTPLTVFLPDGSATDAAVEVVDAEERYIRISVRALTGGARLGDLARRPQR